MARGQRQHGSGWAQHPYGGAVRLPFKAGFGVFLHLWLPEGKKSAAEPTCSIMQQRSVFHDQVHLC